MLHNTHRRSNLTATAVREANMTAMTSENTSPQPLYPAVSCTPLYHLTRMPCSLQEENDVNTIFYIMTDRHRKKNKIPNTVTAAMLKQSNTSLSSVPVPLHKYGRDTVDTIWTKRLGIHLAYNYIYRTASIHNEPHTCTYINSHDQKHNHITRHIKETKIKDNARFIFFTLIHV